MNTAIKVSLIASATVLASVFMMTGRYTTIRAAQGLFVYETDRFSGNVRLCGPFGCRDLPLNLKRPEPVKNSDSGDTDASER